MTDRKRRPQNYPDNPGRRVRRCEACAYDLDGYCRVYREHPVPGRARRCATFMTVAQLAARKRTKGDRCRA